jgi:hypothetical protein
MRNLYRVIVGKPERKRVEGIVYMRGKIDLQVI